MARQIMWTHPDGRTWDRALPPRKVGTLGAQVRLAHCLTLYCLACQRSTLLVPAEVSALAARHGHDLELREMLDRAVCKRCGARWPWLDLTVSPYTMERGGRTVERVEE